MKRRSECDRIATTGGVSGAAPLAPADARPNQGRCQVLPAHGRRASEQIMFLSRSERCIGPSNRNRRRAMDMIYLAEPNLLFVKPKKVAGTSIEIALSCNAGEKDIITPVAHGDELVRYQSGGHFPVNWAYLKATEAQCRRKFDLYIETGKMPPRLFGLRKGKLYEKWQARYYNHITPMKIDRRGPRGFLDNVTMVTVVRDPYEQLVSFAWHKVKATGAPFDQMLGEALEKEPLNDAYLFGSRKPDIVLRYEHLREDLTDLEQRFGLNLVENLPHTKHKARGDRRPARETLSEAHKARCYEKYRRTFETFGYPA